MAVLEEALFRISWALIFYIFLYSMNRWLASAMPFSQARLIHKLLKASNGFLGPNDRFSIGGEEEKGLFRLAVDAGEKMSSVAESLAAMTEVDVNRGLFMFCLRIITTN